MTFRQFTVDHGLTSNTVYAIKQDTKGYIWFGTDNGVCRFDGNSFKYYSKNDGLTDHDVLYIQEDSQGRLWMLTYNGKPCFYKNGHFYNQNNYPPIKDLHMQGFCSSFAEKPDGTIYLGSREGHLYQLNSSDSLIQISTPELRKHLSLSSIWVYNHQVFYGDSKSIITNMTKQKSYKLNLHLDSIPLYTRYTLIDNRIYISRGHWIYEYSTDLKRIRSIELSEEEHIDFIGRGAFSYQLAIGTRNGLRFLNLNTKEISKCLLPGKMITHVTTDSEGGIWVSTLHHGVYYSHPEKLHLFTSQDIPDLPVYSLNHTNDTIWFGAANRKYGAIINDSVVLYNKIPQTRYGDLDEGRILNIWQNSHHIFLRSEKMLFQLKPDRSDIYTDFTIPLTCMENSTNNKIWAGSFGRITPLDSMFNPLNNEAEIHIQGKVMSLLSVDSNTLFCGNYNGLFTMNTKSGNYQNRHPELQGKVVIDMKKLPNERIAIATKGSGLYVYHDSTLIKHFDPIQKENPENIKKMGLTPSGNLWIASSQGIYFQTQTSNPTRFWNWKVIDQSNALETSNVYDLMFLEDKMYIATNKGISVLDTTYIYRNDAPPSLHIEKVTALDSVFRTTEITLPQKFAQQIRVFCHAISFQTQKRFYIFEIDDQPPVYINQINDFFVLPSLSPGSHHISIRVRSDFSDWSEPTQITIKVTQFWWQTSFFHGLIIIGIIAIIILFIKLKITVFNHRLLISYVNKWTNRILGRKEHYIHLKSGKETVRVFVRQIRWIKSESNYCVVATSKQKITVLATLKSFEEQLGNYPQFIRTHRSYLVNIRYASKIQSAQITIDDRVIPIGTTYKKSFKNHFDSLNP